MTFAQHCTLRCLVVQSRYRRTPMHPYSHVTCKNNNLLSHLAVYDGHVFTEDEVLRPPRSSTHKAFFKSPALHLELSRLPLCESQHQKHNGLMSLVVTKSVYCFCCGDKGCVLTQCRLNLFLLHKIDFDRVAGLCLGSFK